MTELQLPQITVESESVAVGSQYCYCYRVQGIGARALGILLAAITITRFLQYPNPIYSLDSFLSPPQQDASPEGPLLDSWTG